MALFSVQWKQLVFLRDNVRDFYWACSLNSCCSHWPPTMFIQAGIQIQSGVLSRTGFIPKEAQLNSATMYTTQQPPFSLGWVQHFSQFRIKRAEPTAPLLGVSACAAVVFAIASSVLFFNSPSKFTTTCVISTGSFQNETQNSQNRQRSQMKILFWNLDLIIQTELIWTMWNQYMIERQAMFELFVISSYCSSLRSPRMLLIHLVEINGELDPWTHSSQLHKINIRVHEV